MKYKTAAVLMQQVRISHSSLLVSLAGSGMSLGKMTFPIISPIIQKMVIKRLRAIQIEILFKYIFIIVSEIIVSQNS